MKRKRTRAKIIEKQLKKIDDIAFKIRITQGSTTTRSDIIKAAGLNFPIEIIENNFTEGR
ncbi:MAG: hypothetical protein EAX96_21290 [Candidatus Lokiarchaeota archaeon]|nr:hypothetical protein [Candidatus Lokiarchaeota archaeon]